MTDKLKKYLEYKVNFEIYKTEKENNYSDEDIEKYLNNLYKWIYYIKNNIKIPLEIIHNIKEGVDKIPNFQDKVNFLINILKILEVIESKLWQMNEIKNSLKEYLNEIKKNQNFINKLSIIESTVSTINAVIEQNNEIKRNELDLLFKKQNKINTENKIKNEKIKLIKLIIDSDKKADVIRLMHKTFTDNLYIDVSYEIFARHFIDNEEKFIQISWLSEMEILKAFIDLLFNHNLAKPEKHNNIFLASHFTLNEVQIIPRNLGDITSYPAYKKIYEKRDKDHPVVELIMKLLDIQKLSKS